MAIEVRFPDLGESVTHAKLTTWLKKAGDRIKAGEAIAEIETDKTNVEIEAPGSGVLAEIRVAEGTDRIPFDTVLALIADTAEEAVPVSASPSRLEPLRAAAVAGTPVAAAPSVLAQADEDDSHLAASPFARRMAYAAGIPLSSIAGTGPGGRITKADVDAVLRPSGAAAAVVAAAPAGVAPPAGVAASAAVPASSPAASAGAYDVQSLTPLRRVTAERLTHAKQTIPHFYLQTDCDAEPVSRMRQELNARHDERVSLTAFIVRAAALALRTVPAANSTWVDGAVHVHRDADIAVAINTEAGLIAPVIRQAGDKSVRAIAGELRALGDRARAGRLKPAEYAGGTFTLSNLGMFGVTSIYPIINPPHSCILGVGALEARPVVRDRAVVPGSVMSCTLSADHRSIDGVTGAELLAAFRRLIEDPWSLVL